MSTKRMNLLECIEVIADKAENSHLSDEFFNEVEGQIGYVSRKLGINRIQAVVLALMVNRSFDTRIELNDLSDYLNCKYIKMLKYSADVEGLVKSHLIACTRGRGDGNLTYRVPPVVIEHLKNNKSYKYELPKNLTINEFFGKLNEYIDCRVNEECSIEGFQNDVVELIENNLHLDFASRTKALELDVNNLALFLFVCDAFIQNREENVRQQDLADMCCNKYHFKSVCNLLMEGKHCLQKLNLIEFCNEDGMVNREEYKLTEDTKRTFLFGVKAGGSDYLSGNFSSLLVDCRSLPAKELFYNRKVTDSIKQLEGLLEQNNFSDICNRLKEKGLRSGFACLFYGAPGTGKTETVYQLARKTDRNIMRVNISEIKSSWVGESEKNIKNVFNKYRYLVEKSDVAPILLFNEADAILGKRMEGAERAVDRMENSIQNIILQEIENMEGILIATTNIAGNLDKAFERRFLYKIEFERPDVQAKSAIWRSMMPDLREDEADKLASLYDFSGGQIENICRKHAIDSILWGEQNPDFEKLKEHCESEVLHLGNSERRKIGFR
ncbi:ATP-binding protein [Phocaeicola barnesiae]|uniref:ATP-binding protein n=1 Tax=Phocaeicola barnesiae TaxID=376804 RepID=UPI00241FD25C|nr:ATP-binding protein [Phocaeicola barnesiae]MDM8242374.1 ATP-binding protein [Phocaeicola barnesiae]